MKIKFPSLFKIPNHRKFHYHPRYYDPEKEEVRQQVERLEREKESSHKEKEVNIRYEFKSLRQRTQQQQGEHRNRIIRVIVIFFILLGFLYLTTLLI